MHSNDPNPIRDNSLYTREKLSADKKEKELNEIKKNIEQIQTAQVAAFDLFRNPIPSHVWRTAWTNTNVVFLIDILYIQKKTLSAALERICDNSETDKEFILEELDKQLNEKLYKKDLDEPKKPFEDYFYPRSSNVSQWAEVSPLMQFPFKK